MKTVRSFLLVPALFAVAGIANAQPPVEEIRRRALVAIEANSKKLSAVLFRSESRSDLSGRQPELRLHIPAFLSHFELVDHIPVSVLDRWEDQPPFELRYPTPQQRLAPGSGFTHSFDDYAKELLNGTHSINFISIKTDRTRRAYELIARPSQTAVPSASAFGKCAANLSATFMIDSETFFPIRMDAEVVRDQGCSYKATHSVLNQVGTRLWSHRVRISGKDRCGDIHDIYVPDRGGYTSPFEDVGAVIMFPGSIAERTFRWGQPAAGLPRLPGLGTGQGYSSITHTTVNSGFKIFLTGSCISFEDDRVPRSGGSFQPLVDLVQTDSYFNFDGTPTIAPAESLSTVDEHSASAIVGLYVRKDKSSDYIALAPDGTFLLRQGGKNYNGNYKIQAGTITIQGQFVPAAVYRLIGNTIIDTAGTVWAKP